MRPERRSVPGLAEELVNLEASLGPDAGPRDVMLLAEGLWLDGQSARAIERLRPLTETRPDLIAPLVLMAWCHDEEGSVTEADRLRRRVAQLDPANPHAVVRVPRTEAAVVEADPEAEAEPERALTEQELRAIPPGPLYSATLAEIFARQGFEQKAIEIYRVLEQAQPERADFRNRLRALERRVGEASP
jgi:tetratricopeptide (TPR) repeat protein